MLFFLYGGLLILSTTGYADFDPKKIFSINTYLLGQPNFSRIDYNVNNALAVEAAIFKKPKENKIYKPYYNDEIPSDQRFIDSEKFAQQMMEQALMLCQISQEYWHSGELDRAIELLDQAYLLILGINTYENDYLIQQKEDLRFTISKRIIEIYGSRKIVVNGSQNEIPVNINKQVQYEIDLYTIGNLRNHFIASYKRSGKYRQMIVDMLKEEDLPQELSWLPLIESGFRVKALSKARALGLWQFIPSTGYKFGLNRNRYIDERLNPVKSTKAAIDYLKELHSHFGDWSTVLAAYNCGETRVLRVIQNQKINYLDNFWDLYTHLPQETARYVPKFFATLHIVKNLEKYGLDNITIDSPLKFESLTVTKKIHLKNAAKIIGIDRKILEELNPELRQNIIPGGKYPLKIPAGSRQILLANIDQILRLNPARVDFIKHRVRSGETLSLIARRYRTSVAYIMLANNLQRANYIISGNTLKIPQKIKPSVQR
ncbi:MAG: transglycosylase SLT domain-containing protein [Deltaproteobacteria bacterium]|nr:transglycosylase SLT domain-containing protein [Deltaproteobacteria bacterium]